MKKLSNGRTIVGDFDLNDIRNLYNTRILLEKNTLTQINPETLEKNMPLIKSIIKRQTEEYNKGIRDVESDLAFHALLLEMTENKTLIQLWRSMRGLIHTLIELTSSLSELEQDDVISEHTNIIEHLKDGNVAEAQLIVEHHLESVRDLLIREFESKLLKS